MHFSTISAAAIAALAFLATPAVGVAVGADIAARSAELDARVNGLEAREAALVCQFGGVKACSVKCIAQGHAHGGYCNSHQVCICNHDD